MASTLQVTVRNTAAQIGRYVKNASEMKVVTNYVEVGTDDGPRLAASTIVRLDGDSESTVPVHAGADGQLRIDDALLAIHERNVETAIEYRSRMLNSLLTTFAAIGRR